MGIHIFQHNNEPDFDPEDTTEIEVITLPDYPLPKVTLVSPTLEVRSVIRDSYIHRVMIANGYTEKEQGND